jgi:hypothetical protein
MSHFWTYDRQAAKKLSRHRTAPAASKAARKLSEERIGHEIAWGPRGNNSNEMLGYWTTRAIPKGSLPPPETFL